MNIIFWHQERLEFRTVCYPCYANYKGESHRADIRLETRPPKYHYGSPQRIVVVELRGGPTLEVELYHLSAVNENLYNFETEDDRWCTLVIPSMTAEDRGEDLDEDIE